MREIKFRAWHKKTNQVLYGLEKLPSLYQIFEVDDFEPMQYTGLKDKNGIEIYEGDILARRAGYDNPEIVRKGIVEFINGKYECSVYYIHKQRLYLFEVASRWEVIGNIYENPELLEAQV